MPIKGLTDDKSDAQGLNLVKLGSLRKGEEGEIKKNKNGKEYKSFGKDLTYFRISFEPEYEHLFPVWKEMYGHQPDTFDNVFIAQGTVEKAFATWKEEYSTIGLLHRCDGEHQVRSYQNGGENKGYWTDAKLDCAKTCECRNVGRLNLIFPEFIDETGAFGYITIRTGAIHDIITIHKMLTDMFKLRQRTGHDLTGIPFTFGRRAKEITSPITDTDGKRTGGRRKMVKSLLFIKPDEEFTKSVLLPSLTTPLLSQPTNMGLQALPEPRELKLMGNERRITSDAPLTVVTPMQTEGVGKKIELGEDGKLIEITPTDAPVIIEGSVTVTEPIIVDEPKVPSVFTDYNPAWWNVVFPTLVKLAHFNGVGTHLANALKALIKDDTLKPDMTPETVIEKVTALYGGAEQIAS